jgi:hypothetical protein
MFLLTTGPGLSARRTALAVPAEGGAWARLGIGVASPTPITHAANSNVVVFMRETYLSRSGND